MTQHNREIDLKGSEAPCVGNLSAHFVDLLKGSEFTRGSDKIAQSGDLLTFTDQAFSAKHGGFDFLSNPVGEVKVDQVSFLNPTAFKPSASCRLDGKPL